MGIYMQLCRLRRCVTLAHYTTCLGIAYSPGKQSQRGVLVEYISCVVRSDRLSAHSHRVAFFNGETSMHPRLHKAVGFFTADRANIRNLG
jgi:hypothetical protein